MRSITVIFILALAAAHCVAAGEDEYGDLIPVVGVVAGQGDVLVSGINGDIPISTLGEEPVVSGDAVTTQGADSWALVHLGAQRSVQLIGDSRVVFGGTRQQPSARLVYGAARYRLCEPLSVSAGTRRFSAAPQGESGAAGALVIESNGRVVAANAGGSLIQEASRMRKVVATATVMAYPPGAPVGIDVTEQVSAAALVGREPPTCANDWAHGGAERGARGD